jgi:hypothetical protein
VVLALLLAVPGAVANAAGTPMGVPQAGLLVVPLTIEGANGRRYRYRVEVAATSEQQAVGMMFRRSMAADQGMIFPMSPPREAAFWMRNTLIPLDLLFIGPDRRIVRIAGMAEPRSERMIPSGGKVIAVLELKGGEAARAGLRVGDRVRW